MAERVGVANRVKPRDTRWSRSVPAMREQINDALQRAVTPDDRGLEKLRGQGKLFVRDRIDLLLDAGSFVEDGLLANASAADLPADGVVTGVGHDRRPPGRASWPTTRR